FYIARGVARALGEQPKKAESDFNRALKLHPNDDEARLWLASAVAMQGDFMRDSTIYPFAQFNRPYENVVREVTKDYGQAVWRTAEAKRDNYDDPDLPKVLAEQKQAIAKFPDLANRFVARAKSANPKLATVLIDRVKQQY